MYLGVTTLWMLVLVVCLRCCYGNTCDSTKYDDSNSPFVKVQPYIKTLIDTQISEGFTNCALEYNNRPAGKSSLLGIEFDHIPPSKFYKTEAERKQAPTLSISQNDHYSPLCYQCTTGTPTLAKIFDFYREVSWPNERKTSCVIWANLKCLRDKEAVPQVRYLLLIL